MSTSIELFEPRFDTRRLGFVCDVCGEGERVFIQHPNNKRVLVCALDGTHYATPEDGPWPLND